MRTTNNTKIKTLRDLKSKLSALGDLDEDTKKSVVCSLIGHSNIQTWCFGYVSCARCGDQVGDSLMGLYRNGKQVIVGHNCEVCQENYAKMTWKDKYMAPDPFKPEETESDGQV